MNRTLPHHDQDNANGEALATHMATPAATPAATHSAPREVRIHTIHQVAGMLGVTVADVLDLIRRGALRAKLVASSTVVSGDALADFMATCDAASRFPRFTEGQPVVLVDDDGQARLRPLRRRDGGRPGRRLPLPASSAAYEQSFAPEQVQPLTCRLPTPASS